MFQKTTRRQFLGGSVAGGAVLGLGGMSFLSKLPAVSAADAKLDAKKVRYSSDIEPLVRLLEETPRERLLETVADKIQRGTSYREVLAALLLAGVRNVEPRPSVGFKFHAVLVVNSAHLASLASPASDRWLPIFWALDYYKAKQLEEESRQGWKMAPVDESAVPKASQAKTAFVAAMQNWDEPAADAAVAGLVRAEGAHEVFELFARIGARDFRSIGHKAIFVANSYRTLQCIGWRYAEPVLRSLAYALLNHDEDSNPTTGDLPADRPGRRNAELAKNIRPDWLDGKQDEAATREMLAVFHNGSEDEACDLAVELLQRGVSPQSVWDAVFLGAGELLMRAPGIVGLHGLTSTNALHYAFESSSDDTTRRFLLLQNCAFLPLFRQAAGRRQKVQDLTVEGLAAVPVNGASPAAAIDDIFTDVSGDRVRAAGKIRSYVKGTGSATDVIDAARRLIFVKGSDAHDYKFSSAVLEDYFHVSPAWRDLFLATSVFNLKGTGDRDNRLVERTRHALA